MSYDESSNKIQQDRETPKTAQNRARSGKEGNRNAEKHGLFAARRVLSEFGLRAIDGRSAVGVAIREFRSSVIKDLGGEAAISAQQKALLDVLIRTKIMLDSLDAYILSQPSLVNRRNRSVLPVVRERQSLANSFLEHLAMLGLKRVPKPAPTLAEFVAQRAAARKQANESGQASNERTNRVPETGS
jgi:hypothetical protein